MPASTHLLWPRAHRRRAYLLGAYLLCAYLALTSHATQAETNSPATAAPFDVVITHGHVIDGTGSPWYSADIGIRNGHIVAIGALADAKALQHIDAGGRVVAPGFIDMLGQSELTVLVDPTVPSKIFQGITTEITGEGESIAPLSGGARTAMHTALEHFHITADWTNFEGYFHRLEQQGIGINLGSYVGATTVREIALGADDRAPSTSELDRMRTLVREAMEQGALGISSSLAYAPAPYASTEELIALAKEAAHFGGIYATHMRSEGDNLMSALDETFRIAKEADIPVEIWHLKVAGKANWGQMPTVIAAINEARTAGIDVAADTYAYTAWFNDMSAFIPPWAHDGGQSRLIERLKDPKTRARIKQDMTTPSHTWDNEWLEIPGPDAILLGVTQNPSLHDLQGQTIEQIAHVRGTSPIDTLLDILIEDTAFTQCAVFGMAQEDVTLALTQPWVSIDNDSSGTSPTGLLGEAHPHPRAYGTFPRILRKYVREEHALTLEEAIRKFSALPAGRLKLADRGVIKQGMWADLVIFDPDTITDRASFEDPNQLSIGMQWVLVNGVPVIADGIASGARPGKVLRGPGYHPPVMHEDTGNSESPSKVTSK